MQAPLPFSVFLQSATPYIRFWLAQPLSSIYLYSVLLSSNCVRLCSLYLPKCHLTIGLLDMGFHLSIFYTILSSAMRSTWPTQFNLCFFIKPNHILSFQYTIYFLISFNSPVAISCSCRTIYFPHDLSFESHQFICHIFPKHPRFGVVSYCWAN